MTTDPAKRTDRTARKATAEQVMELLARPTSGLEAPDRVQ